MTDQHKLLATCAFGLEAILKRELIALGYPAKVVSPGKLSFEGSLEAIIETNLWLRTADRVQIEIGTFEAPDFEALFETVRAFDWARWIPPDGSFPVKGRSYQSQLSSVPACQRAVKKAIVENLRAGHNRQELPEDGELYQVEVAILKNQATLTIDTTGPSLHKRGYRTLGAPAPLKETLASALVQLSFWNAERPFLDPFCGSGTIAIEAAMLGREIAPGLKREFACEKWPTFQKQPWQDHRQSAKERIKPNLDERLVAADVDERALYAARINAENAGVGKDIHFQPRDFQETSSKRRYGCVITNPPYGERIGERLELQQLYESLPIVLRKLPTWSHYILTAFEKFERVIGRRADRRRKLYNGRIECTYYQFHGPHPTTKQSAPVEARVDSTQDQPSAQANVDEEGDVAKDSLEDSRNAPVKSSAEPSRKQVRPAFGGITNKAREQADLFRSRLTKRARHLRRWPTKRGITCFRIYERDIPEIPLVVDRYEDYLHITEFERPHDRDPAQHADWLELMAKVAGETLEVPKAQVFMKTRLRQRGSKQHERMGDQGVEVPVTEGGLTFRVNLSDYVDTGLFLDHRVTRAKVREESKGKHFLNLFAYTGSFSVYAADGGAASTTTVDWSNTYLDWARLNMSQNGFSGADHRFVRRDTREYLNSLPLQEQFDLAVMDPPTFSNSKRTEEVWDVQQHYADVLNQLLLRMREDGVIYFSTNSRRFKFDEAVIDCSNIREISRQTVPEDFRNRRIHRCWRMVKEA